MTDFSKVCSLCHQFNCVCVSPENQARFRREWEEAERAQKAEEDRKKQARRDEICALGREDFSEYERGLLRRHIEERLDDDQEARTLRMQKAHEARVKEMIGNK